MTTKCFYPKEFDKLPYNEKKEKIIDYCNLWILNNNQAITKLILENELSNDNIRQKCNCNCDNRVINNHRNNNSLIIKYLEDEIIDYTNTLNEAMEM